MLLKICKALLAKNHPPAQVHYSTFNPNIIFILIRQIKGANIMVVKIKGNKLWIIVICILLLVIIITSVTNIISPKHITIKDVTSNKSNIIQQNTKLNFENIRGVWVPYFSLQTEKGTKKEFENNFDKIVNTAYKTFCRCHI